MGLNRIIFGLFLWGLSAINIYGQDLDGKFELRADMRLPDKWELILETVTEEDNKVFLFMESFRANDYSKLLKYNHSLCLSKEDWKSYLIKYDLIETALYLPIALSNGERVDCKKSESVFAKMAEFSGKSTDYINHLKGIWGVEKGFENFLYNYRISIRLIENLALPENCKTLKKTHTVLEGQTLYRLSIIYGVSVESIQLANNLGLSTHINSGSVLVIP